MKSSSYSPHFNSDKNCTEINYKSILPMKGRPVAVVIVAILFILTGTIGFVYHTKDLFNSNNVLPETVWVLVLRILAVLCGILLLCRKNWARWLAVAWMLYHVVIGALNSTAQMITHIFFLVAIVVLLFLPVSSKYFHGSNKLDRK